jgi:hypothetical protein
MYISRLVNFVKATHICALVKRARIAYIIQHIYVSMSNVGQQFFLKTHHCLIFLLLKSRYTENNI